MVAEIHSGLLLTWQFLMPKGYVPLYGIIIHSSAHIFNAKGKVLM